MALIISPVQKREPQLIVVTGVKRIGKSNETIRYLYNDYCRGGLGRKVLIFDFNNEFGNYEVFEKKNGQQISYRVNIPRLAPEDILRFSNQKMIEMRRVVPLDKWGMPLSLEDQGKLIQKTMTEFRGGCLFIEDLNAVFGDSLPAAISGFFVNNAHRDCDVLLHVQSIARVVPKIWQNCNIVRRHRENVSTEESREKLKTNFTLFKLGELIVDYQYDNLNERYFLWIDKDHRKLKGNITKGMFDKAVIDFLQLYPGEIRRKEKMEDIYTGKKLFNREQILTDLKESFSRDYFGNRQ